VFGFYLKNGQVERREHNHKKNKIGTMLIVFTTAILNGNRKAFIDPMMNIETY
jgi:hypothetical protein